MRGIPRYTLVWGACYTLGARYLSKNTVIILLSSLGYIEKTEQNAGLS